MSSANSLIMSVTLTDRIIEANESVRRLATYDFYDGKSKTTKTHDLTVVGYGKAGETLKKLKSGEVVAEGRLNLSKAGGSTKDLRLEIILGRIHF